MKRALWMTILLLPAASLYTAEVRLGDPIPLRKPEIRVVNSISVDVSPVRSWLRDREGDRPLKHWKELQVFSLKGNLSTMQQCVVKTEEGKFTEILIKNLPASVSDFLAAFANHDAAIARLQNEISSEEAALRREDAATATGVVVAGTYVEVLTQERARLNLKAAALQEKKDLLAKFTAEREAMRIKSPEATSILAMFTGRTFSNLPVWDCGIAK